MHNNIMTNLSKIMLACLALPLLHSCSSGDKEFDDFDTQTVYFAKQYPVRTIELGYDEYVDLTDDNAHRIIVKATMGGAYNNPRTITANLAVDNSLCNGLKFKADGSDITPMPSSHYVLDANTITIPKGEISAGVEIKMTEAFFNDPLSLTTHYVIPLKMSNVQGADSILNGKDFVLYAVKYINQYHGLYVRQKDPNDATDADQDFSVTTLNLTTAAVTYPLKDGSGTAYPCDLKLDFASGTVSSETDGFNVSGSVSFVERDQTQMIGNKHPNTIHLNFSAQNSNVGINANVSVALNLKYRGVIPETFELLEE